MWTSLGGGGAGGEELHGSELLPPGVQENTHLVTPGAAEHIKYTHLVTPSAVEHVKYIHLLTSVMPRQVSWKQLQELPTTEGPGNAIVPEHWGFDGRGRGA